MTERAARWQHSNVPGASLRAPEPAGEPRRAAIGAPANRRTRCTSSMLASCAADSYLARFASSDRDAHDGTSRAEEAAPALRPITDVRTLRSVSAERRRSVSLPSTWTRDFRAHVASRLGVASERPRAEAVAAQRLARPRYRATQSSRQRLGKPRAALLRGVCALIPL